MIYSLCINIQRYLSIFIIKCDHLLLTARAYCESLGQVEGWEGRIFSRAIMIIKIRKQFQHQFMSLSRVSLLDAHLKNTTTDSLYNVLRKAVEQDTTRKKPLLETATKHSRISKYSFTHNLTENNKLASEVFIPEKVRLKRCYDLSKIPRNRKYCIVNVQQKELDPITPDQLQHKLKFFSQQQIIVYTYGDQEQQEKHPVLSSTKTEKLYAKPPSSAKTEKLFAKPPSSTESPEPKKPRRMIERKKRKLPKYNFFSMFDEAVNNLIEGKSCTCPANEIVAQRRYQISWQLEEEDIN